MIKPYFHPTDTIYDVVRKVQENWKQFIRKGNKIQQIFYQIFKCLPQFLMRFLVLPLHGWIR